MRRKTFAIFGLGRFGMTLARELTELGHDVIAVDKDLSLVQTAGEFCNAMSFDMTDVDIMRKSGIADADIAIIASGSSLEDSILCVLNLNELGIENIIVKARDEKCATALIKIGASQVVLPEKEMGKNLAAKIASEGNLIELFNLGDDNLVFEMKVKSEWVGKNLIEINPRANYDINVIALKRGFDISININPQDKFEKDDIIVCIGNERAIRKRL